MKNKIIIGCMAFLITMIVSGCYGNDSKVTVYNTIAELEEKEDMEFHDFHDPLSYLLENKQVPLSEYEDLGIVVPPNNEDQSCWFNLSKDSEDLYIKYVRNGNPLQGSKSKRINNQTVNYVIENDTTCFIEFQLDYIRYEIIVYEYQDKFTTNKLFEYIQSETI